MCDFDYIPIDQEVINQAVAELQKRRNEAKEILKDACKNAEGNYDIIVFRNDRKRRVRALEELRIFWCESDREILVSRNELYDTIYDRSGD